MIKLNEYNNKVINGDCIKVLKEFPDECIDLVITDPPYLVNYYSKDGRSVSANDNPYCSSWLKPAFSEIYRVLKNNSFCVCFYGFNHAEKFIYAWKSAGFRVLEQLIWRKSYDSSIGLVYRYHESAYLLAKGKSAKPNLIIPSVLYWKYSGNNYHPTQKPVNAISPLVEAYSAVDNFILDPFAGSGSTGVACQMHKRNFIGIELSPKYCQIANKRLFYHNNKKTLAPKPTKYGQKFPYNNRSVLISEYISQNNLLYYI